MKRMFIVAFALAFGASLIGIVVPTQSNAAVQLTNVFRANKLFAGTEHICFITNSFYHCAGENGDGQLGSGDNTDLNYGKAIRDANDSMLFANVFESTVGANHSCFITAPNAAVQEGVYCWGDNQYGQLGDGTTADKNVPTRVADNQASGFVNTSVDYVYAGYNHTCAVKSDQIYCWGRNNKGQLGNNSTTDSPLAVKPGGVFATANASQAVTLGESHSCATHFNMSPRTVYCWGDNQYGQLGDGTNTDRTTPVATNITGAAGASEAQFAWSLASTADSTCMAGNSGFGNVYCWGRNDAGQVGDGTKVNKNVPTLVGANGTFVNNYTQGASTSASRRLGAGGKTVCARTVAGSTPNRYLHCWGENGGKIAGSANADETLPVAIPSNSLASFNPSDDQSSFDSIAVSMSSPTGFACFAKWCWGTNTKGQLAQGDMTNHNMPVVIKTGTTQSSGGGGGGGGSPAPSPTRVTGVSGTAVLKNSNVEVTISGLPSSSLTSVTITVAPTSFDLSIPRFGSSYTTYSGTRLSGSTLPTVTNGSFTTTVSRMTKMTYTNGVPGTPVVETFSTSGEYHVQYSVTGAANATYANGWLAVNAASASDTIKVTVDSSSATAAAPTTTDAATTTTVANVFAAAKPGVTVTDTKVYTTAPAEVAADSAINVLTKAQNRIMDIETKTPSICLPNDDELVFIDEGKCIAEVVNAKTRAVLRVLKTTVVSDDISEVKVGNAIVTLAPIYFDAMSATLDAKATARLKSLKSQISAAGSVLIIGHSGTLNGNSPANIAISKARATSTLAALKAIGAKGPFAVSGVGALDPARDGKTEAAQAKNRRVVIALIP